MAKDSVFAQADTVESTPRPLISRDTTSMAFSTPLERVFREADLFLGSESPTTKPEPTSDQEDEDEEDDITTPQKKHASQSRPGAKRYSDFTEDQIATLQDIYNDHSGKNRPAVLAAALKHPHFQDDSTTLTRARLRALIDKGTLVAPSEQKHGKLSSHRLLGRKPAVRPEDRAVLSGPQSALRGDVLWKLLTHYAESSVLRLLQDEHGDDAMSARELENAIHAKDGCIDHRMQATGQTREVVLKELKAARTADRSGQKAVVIRSKVAKAEGGQISVRKRKYTPAPPRATISTDVLTAYERVMRQAGRTPLLAAILTDITAAAGAMAPSTDADEPTNLEAATSQDEPPTTSGEEPKFKDGKWSLEETIHMLEVCRDDPKGTAARRHATHITDTGYSRSFESFRGKFRGLVGQNDKWSDVEAIEAKTKALRDSEEKKRDTNSKKSDANSRESLKRNRESSQSTLNLSVKKIRTA